MNERIRDLGTQAGLYVDLNGSPWPRAMSAEECEAAYKKFAQLIVQECANELLKWKSEPFPLDPESAARIIQEHFRVEE